jgi:hypothetical protein
MTYGRAYTRLREIAARQIPPINLKYKAANSVKRAYWEAVAMQDGGQAKARFRRTLRAYPKLMIPPFGYLARLGLQKLSRRTA